VDNKSRILLLCHAVLVGIGIGTLVGAAECLRTEVDIETLLAICAPLALAGGFGSMLYLLKKAGSL
tara:strand:+ start:1279 stop:1476 length:198 start_codon:yes stop_codon:yes gene_type:complete